MTNGLRLSAVSSERIAKNLLPVRATSNARFELVSRVIFENDHSGAYILPLGSFG